MATVYILRSGDTDLYKIGFTKGNADGRIKQLNTGNPVSLVLVACIETDEGALCETYLHQKLRSKKFLGSGGTEFYRLDSCEINTLVGEATNFIETYIASRTKAKEFEIQQSEERVLLPTVSLRDTFSRLLEVREQMDALRYERDMLEFELKIAIGTAAELQGIASWKSTQVDRFDQEAFKTANPELFVRFKRQQWQRRFMLANK